jgi:hypothetical protein
MEKKSVRIFLADFHKIITQRFTVRKSILETLRHRLGISSGKPILFNADRTFYRFNFFLLCKGNR